MDNKEICQILSDLIAVSNRPHIVNGQTYGKRRGTVNLTAEARDAILELMAQTHCRKVKFGSYECCEQTMHGFSVDGCLVGEINKLNNDGVKTIGCCCGHGKSWGYIQVDPKHIDEMKKWGYAAIDVDEYENGKWCFTPKTSLPEPCDIAKYLERCDDCGFCDTDSEKGILDDK